MSTQPLATDASDSSLWARGVPRAEIPEAWETVRPLIARALEYNPRFTPEDIRERLIDGQAQLFVTPDTVCVTEIVNYPRAKVLNIFLVAGRMPVPYLAAVEAWARSMGCAEIEETGRPGWEKALGTLGYQRRAVTMVKQL